MYYVKQIEHAQKCKFRLSTDNEYGFLFVIRGSTNIKILGSICSDDFIVCAPNQIIEIEYSDSKNPISALWVRIPISTMEYCSSPNTNILASFQINPNPIVRIVSHNPYLMLVKSLAVQLKSIPGDNLFIGIDLMEKATLQMFLTLVINICFFEDPHRTKGDAKNDNRFSLDEVFTYIHTHLTEDLSLDKLEQVFFVSRHHLIREFKKRTGQTVHQYIVNARLELSRRYIEQGYSINEVYRMGGFSGYNHFFKVFKKTYGITPKEYYQSTHPGDKSQ